MKSSNLFSKLTTTLAISTLFFITTVFAKPDERSKKVIDHWTNERIAAAIPRDMAVDKKGFGYIRRKDGSLIPHGHNRLTEFDSKAPNARPGGNGGSGSEDTTGPLISHIAPGNGATVGLTQRFAADISDASGVRSASLIITYPSGATESFSMSNSSGDVWENTLTGFTDGPDWSWHVEARDGSKGKGITTISNPWIFTIDTGSDGGSGSEDSVANEAWIFGGSVQTVVGRLFFEMPSNSRHKRWVGYVCSGSVATDITANRSVIITAAHCVYDDANKAFARNVLFIPNQDATSGSGTDSNCNNDPLGCWTPAFGVVDANWTTSTFPANIPWDYAYYVVSDTGAHSGTAASSDALDMAAGHLPVDFSVPVTGDGTNGSLSPDFTFALGYSYSNDPNFMYCADGMITEGSDNWWLPICGLSGGSSGGPWIQDMNLTTGDGPIISINSWGYTDRPGMAGPKLSGTTASCLFEEAKVVSFSSVASSDGNAGIAVNNCI